MIKENYKINAREYTTDDKGSPIRKKKKNEIDYKLRSKDQHLWKEQH